MKTREETVFTASVSSYSGDITINHQIKTRGN